MAELALASYETIARRTLMMAAGTCSPTEYNRMVREKVQASYASSLALATGRGGLAALAPWHRRAAANAKRLRRKK